MRKGLIGIIAVGFMANSAVAAETPAPIGGKFDNRVKIAEYHPDQIYIIHNPQNQATAIRFTDEETDADATGATDEMLKADAMGSLVVINSGETSFSSRSLFVKTTLPDGKSRLYQFQVDTVPPDSKEATYSLKFTYPADDFAKRAAAWRAAQAEKRKRESDQAIAALEGPPDSNFSYVLQGDKAQDWNLLPTREVADNGTATRFKFPGSMAIPIIWAVEDDEKKVIVEPTFNSKTRIATVHRLAPRWRLERGDAVLCVENRAYDPVGVRSETNTVSPDVIRITK